MSVHFDYEIIEQLHASARSVVYRARAAGEQGALIIKMPNREFPSFQEITRFKREYAIAMRYAHPGIVRPLALRQERGRWTMIQEDIGGTALGRVLQGRLGAGGARSQPAIGLGDFFDIALQLCAALDAVHCQGVIHKDINPSNLVWNSARRHLQLIDFGIASELAQEVQGIVNPYALEGTLRYMAPEQTGRMNRAVDYRADYYALGATFYELLTGQPPFAASDPMELVHCHLARIPDWSHSALADLPQPLLAIIQRLLEKNPEQRYQTLYGLKRDLEACRAAAPCALGSFDRNPGFMVSQKLHGRERELEALLAALDRTCAGASEMLLVTGSPGIGKSALVSEMHSSIVARRGCFVSGKCEQYRRDVPYASLLQAFQGLILQLLGEPDERMERWAGTLRTALGSSLGVMVELIPELALVVGATEPVAPLAPEQAHSRLSRAFQGFVAAFSSAGQPLVLFLDDLQWADAPTLRMIAFFMRERGHGHVLFIGAWRDSDTQAAQPLVALGDQLQQAGVRQTRLVLGALTEAQAGQLIGATLRVPVAACAPLTRLCYRKTGGNPFFLNQFLHAIHDAGHMVYQVEQDCWGWNLAALEQAGYTDNVVDLLLEKIRRLPPETQQLLQLAAALGNRFRLDTLALLVGRAPAQAQQALWPALDAGLVEPLDQRYKYVDAEAPETEVGYRFLHDRVQQAADAIAGAGERPARYLRIARLRLQHATAQQVEEQLFAIVGQFNAGSALIDTGAERLLVAGLNRQAGLKARRSAAFQATLEHMRAGLAMLPEDAWQRHPALWLDLQLGAAEAAYLCGQFDTAEALYPQVSARCALPLHRIRCINVQAHQYQLQGRLPDAMRVLRAGLALLDIDIPHEAAEQRASFSAGFADLSRYRRANEPEALLAAGDMGDPAAIAAMDMMQGMWMASYYAGQQDLSELMVLSMTRLSMQQGSSDFSSAAYVGYASMLGLKNGDLALGYRFGAMALTLARRRSDLQTRIQTGLMFAALISHWTHPLRNSDALYDEAFDWALEIADFVQVGMVVAVRATERLILGDYLPELKQAIERDLALMRANGQQAMADCCVAAAVQPIKCLMGQTWCSDNYDDDGFSEARFLEQYGTSRLYHAYFLQGKIRNACLFDGADAEALAGQLDIVARMMRGQAKVPESTFYAALIWIRALRRDPQRADGPAIRERVAALLASLEAWAGQGPDNIAAKHFLVQAELARERQDLALATRYYQQGIAAAGAGGYVQVQALGNELCGECWLEQGQARVAAVYLHDALAGYRQWGADGKAAQLSARHAALLAGGAERAARWRPASITHSATTPALAFGNAALDLDSILKAAHALSNEIGLRNVLARLIAIVRENSGAQAARLLLLEEGVCRVEADIAGDTVAVLQGRSLVLDAATDPQFPLSLLRYVIRTGAEVIEDNIASSPRFAADPYVRLHCTRSVLCLPIRQGGRLDGILYLENNLAEASFTQERVEFLRILGAQAVISIAHARLHDSLEQRVAERTAQLEEANGKLATLSATDGLTGLANRRHFDEVLRSEWARARRLCQPLAVIMVDVDHFKKYNDCYGHQAGDDCLVRVAGALKTGTRRSSDLAARYGGEEFCIVLPNTGAQVALEIGEALLRAIEQLAIAHERASAGMVTISVGVAVAIDDDGPAPDALMRAADAALYRAKHAGRNCAVLDAPGSGGGGAGDARIGR